MRRPPSRPRSEPLLAPLIALAIAGCHAPVRAPLSVPALTPAPPPAIAALLTLARKQDPATVADMAARLDDRDARVRATAAWALGQLGVSWAPLPEAQRAEAERRLVAALLAEHEHEPRERLVEALGKLGRGPGVEVLIGRLGGLERARAAIALGLVAKSAGKEAVPMRALPGLLALFLDGDPDVRWAAAYAFQRWPRLEARAFLLAGLHDHAAEVRAMSAKAIAEVAQPDDASWLAPILDDADVRVAAEAGRTLAKLAARCAPEGKSCPAIDALKEATQLRAPVMAAVAAEPIIDARAAAAFRAQYDLYANAVAPDRATRARAQCRAALAHDRAAGRVELLQKCGAGVVPDEERDRLTAVALGEMKGDPAARSSALVALSQKPSLKVREAAAEQLAGFTDEASAHRLIELLSDPDHAVVAAAAESVARRKLAGAAQPVLAGLDRFRGPDAVETLEGLLGAAAALKLADAIPRARALAAGTPYAVALAAADALRALGEASPPFQAAAPDERPFADTPLPSRDMLVRIETERGTIRVRLFPDEAPANVRSFLHLVRARFYDGLTFHRVVPGFVSQGGDPRGDGSGGPGYLVPCEIGTRRYGTGAMGMALAGRDTGGSQFFFTHTPQPHLDGRYTLFGQITDGVEVAVSLVEGDRILSIREE